MQRTPIEVENAIVKMYNNGCSMHRIVELLASINYSISVTTVFNILKRNGIQSRPNVETVDLNPDELKELYYVKHMPLAAIAEKYGVCVNTVRNYLDADGSYEAVHTRQDFDLKQDYFSTIDTEGKAYLLGYLLADGNVYYPEQGNPKLRMQLHVKDISVLEFMRSELNSVNTIQYNTRNGEFDDTCTFCVTSQQLVQDLAQYGMVPAKTYKLHLPTLPEPYMQHMLRGYFDGDGSVIFTDNCKAVDFSGMPYSLQQVQKYFMQTLGVSEKEIYTHESEYTDGNVYIDSAHIMWGGRNEYGAILDYLYKDATIYLQRKYDLACNIWFNTK